MSGYEYKPDQVHMGQPKKAPKPPIPLPPPYEGDQIGERHLVMFLVLFLVTIAAAISFIRS